jgi:hypothetical protein
LRENVNFLCQQNNILYHSINKLGVQVHKWVSVLVVYVITVCNVTGILLTYLLTYGCTMIL